MSLALSTTQIFEESLEVSLQVLQSSPSSDNPKHRGHSEILSDASVRAKMSSFVTPDNKDSFFCVTFLVFQNFGSFFT